MVTLQGEILQTACRAKAARQMAGWKMVRLVEQSPELHSGECIR